MLQRCSGPPLPFHRMARTPFGAAAVTDPDRLVDPDEHPGRARGGAGRQGLHLARAGLVHAGRQRRQRLRLGHPGRKRRGCLVRCVWLAWTGSWSLSHGPGVEGQPAGSIVLIDLSVRENRQPSLQWLESGLARIVLAARVFGVAVVVPSGRNGARCGIGSHGGRTYPPLILGRSSLWIQSLSDRTGRQRHFSFSAGWRLSDHGHRSPVRPMKWINSVRLNLR